MLMDLVLLEIKTPKARLKMAKQKMVTLIQVIYQATEMVKVTAVMVVTEATAVINEI